jgi:lipoyl(octanoyl) transferase
MIQYLYLGRVDYSEALRLQSEIVALRTEGRTGNTLLLLEHPPVLTLGRNARRANILASGELLTRRGVTLHEINRGGDVTYHGPGQLIGYPIFDLRSLRNANGMRLGPVDFVRLMEESLIRLCGEFGVPAGRIRGLTGVWCGVHRPDAPSDSGVPQAQDAQGQVQLPGVEIPRIAGSGTATSSLEAKIAAIGIHVARGVTSHGFAFNVTTDLRDFALINPCGITDRPVTSLEKEIARDVADPKALPNLETIAHRAARQFGLVFNQQVLALENLEALRAQVFPPANAGDSSAPEFPIPESQAPEFPAQDTPLQVPTAIERLRSPKPRPVSA